MFLYLVVICQNSFSMHDFDIPASPGSEDNNFSKSSENLQAE